MGSSYPTSGDLEIVTVTTESLRERLNQMYTLMRQHPPLPASAGLFEYLWDLKELALLEGRSSVQVPTNWLSELDRDFLRSQLELSH